MMMMTKHRSELQPVTHLGPSITPQAASAASASHVKVARLQNCPPMPMTRPPDLIQGEQGGERR